MTSRARWTVIGGVALVGVLLWRRRARAAPPSSPAAPGRTSADLLDPYACDEEEIGIVVTGADGSTASGTSGRSCWQGW